MKCLYFFFPFQMVDWLAGRLSIPLLFLSIIFNDYSCFHFHFCFFALFFLVILCNLLLVYSVFQPLVCILIFKCDLNWQSSQCAFIYFICFVLIFFLFSLVIVAPLPNSICSLQTRSFCYIVYLNFSAKNKCYCCFGSYSSSYFGILLLG